MGTKNASDSFISSVISTNASAFPAASFQYPNAGNPQLRLGTVVNSTKPTSLPKPPNVTPVKHKLPMQLSRPSTTGSIGVSVITPAVGVSAPKEVPGKHYHQQQRQQQHQQQQQQIVQKIQSVRNTGEAYGRTNLHANVSKLAQPSPGVTITPLNNAYNSAKTKNMGSVSTPSASMVHSHTQHLPKYLSSSRFLVNTEKGDVYLNDDGTFGEIPDKRALYSNSLPPDYQYVLQDHSYSQLPESPPPPTTPPTPPVQQRTAINGLSRVPASSVGPTKVSLANSRQVTVGSGGISSLTNNVGGNRASSQGSLPQLHSSLNSGYSSINTIVNNVAANHVQNTPSVIAVNPRKHLQSHMLAATSLANLPRTLLANRGIISDKPEESDLSEDDRLPDPHGEETETAPEAEGEEESFTRCICDFQHDDGYMICCDKCSAWQHVVCMGIDWHHIPEEYLCEKCQPRFVDKRRAIEIQKKKIAERQCVGLNDDSDSSDTPVTNARNNKNQTKRKYKGRKTGIKKKPIKETKDVKPKKNLGPTKKRLLSDSAPMSSLPSSPLLSSNTSMTAEKKKQLLIERKQMLLEKKQMTKKRSMRKQAQTKRNMDKNKVSKLMEEDTEPKNVNNYDEHNGENDRSIQKVRDWVDRYEEAVTNHYSQELRARLSAVQVNGVHSDLKFSATLRSVEKCRTSLLSTGGKIVLATSSVSPNQPIIELRGKYMWTGASSFKQNNISHSTPYVFYYKLPKNDIEICVDCRTYGNFARFVRRSCKPNAELRHCIRKTSLHLYIIATQPMKKNSEILIGHYSPDTANVCACGSSDNCTATRTPYPVIASRNSDKNPKESHPVKSLSPAPPEATPKNKKTPMNADKNKKKPPEEKKKLTKEKRRGRRRSPSSGSNTTQESSSREPSPSAPPSKLTVNMWSKSTVNSAPANDSADVANKENVTNVTNDSQSECEDRPSTPSPVTTPVAPSINEKISPPAVSSPASSPIASTPPVPATVADTPLCSTQVSTPTTTTSLSASESTTTTTTVTAATPAATPTSSTKQNPRSTRQTEYAKKEKQQLDMPLFFPAPNNHKMTREEKKIQAIMKVFEQMEKSEARKQENQRHRRESTSESESTGKKTSFKKNYKSRRSVDESSDRDEKSSAVNSRKNSHKDTDHEDSAESTKENTSNNRDSAVVKEESKSDEPVVSKAPRLASNALLKARIKKEEIDDDEDKDEDDEDNDENDNDVKSAHLAVKSVNLTPKKAAIAAETESDDGETDNVTVNMSKGRQVRKKAVGTRTPNNTRARVTKPGPKARVTPKVKATRAKKRKSASDNDKSADVDANDTNERPIRSLRQRKAANNSATMKDEKLSNERKNSVTYSPGKFRKVDDHLGSPYSTPPKRERLDSSSSSGGTPPTPVSDTCLLVAAAVGHLTDFKFPNTKKELMNAWFKEERKPSPEEESGNKLTTQEGNNEYAKKRWLRQAISEEGDNLLPRPEESVSPNGDYGGPLKKRRFARESLTEFSCDSSGPTITNTNQISLDDDDDVSSPCVLYFRPNGVENIVAHRPFSVEDDVTSKTNETENAFKSGDDDVFIASKPTTPVTVVPCPTKMTVNEVSLAVSSMLQPIGAITPAPPPPPSLPPPPLPPLPATPPPPPPVSSPPQAAVTTQPVRTPSPPPVEAVEKPLNRSPPVSKKKLSLTEYQQRKNINPPLASPSVESVISEDVAQEVPALANAPLPTIDPAESVERSSSRSSVTSSSCSEEEDNSQAASAQVIARSLMIESRHLSYGPQASALFNSLRSGTIGQAGSTIFNSKTGSTTNGPPLPRENLADRLKREFDVHVQEDEAEKNKNMPPPASPIKTHVTVPVPVPVPAPVPAPVPPPVAPPDMTLAQKDLHLRMKKVVATPPPPPPPLPCIPTSSCLAPPPILPPLPDAPQLFASPYYPYAVPPRVRPFFVAPPPPPPPPPGPPPGPPISLPQGPPPPPPPAP